MQTKQKDAAMTESGAMAVLLKLITDDTCKKNGLFQSKYISTFAQYRIVLNAKTRLEGKKMVKELSAALEIPDSKESYGIPLSLDSLKTLWMAMDDAYIKHERELNPKKLAAATLPPEKNKLAKSHFNYYKQRNPGDKIELAFLAEEFLIRQAKDFGIDPELQLPVQHAPRGKERSK
jgi:hypothetical protein